MSQILLKLTPTQLAELTLLAFQDNRSIPQFLRNELIKLGHMSRDTVHKQSSPVPATPVRRPPTFRTPEQTANDASVDAEIDALNFDC